MAMYKVGAQYMYTIDRMESSDLLGELSDEADNELSVLEHVVKVEVVDEVSVSVEVRVEEIDGRLGNHGRWVTIAVGRGVVRASIAAAGVDGWD